MTDTTTTAAPSPEAVPVTQTAPTAPVTEHIVTPEKLAASAPVQPKMEDTIRTKLRELNKAAETPRGPDGKFQKTADLAGQTVAEPATNVVEPATEEPIVEEAAVETPASTEEVKPAVNPALEKAPSSWKKDVQAKWAALDPEVRAEVLRREADFHKGIEGYKGWANVGQTLDAEIRPYEAMIRAAGTTPQAIIKDVFNTIYQLKTGSPEQKAAVALNILTEYGVDLETVTAASAKIAEGQPAVDPLVQQLAAKLTKLEQDQQEREQAARQNEFADVVQEAQAFAKAPGHEHYETVKLEMAAFIESGVCSTLQEAYDKAIWASPQVRAKLQAQQAEAKRKQAAEKAAAAKKAASTNVVPRGTLPATPKVGTMDDTIRAKLREITARG